MKYIKENEEMDQAIKYIKNGKLVIFPTETVYGIGANALDKEAVNKIFDIKGRKQDNPLIVHIEDMNMLDDLVIKVNEIEKKLMDKFWPGPLTIILPKKDVIPDNVTCGLNTVGIRMPSNEIARKLIKEAGVPIAAPSANISGKPSGTMTEDILSEFSDYDLCIIDGGNSQIGLESTVVKVEYGEINILRPGYITYEQLSKIAPTNISKNVLSEPKDNEQVESPGMKYRHYAPNCKCALVVGTTDMIRKKILGEITDIKNEGKKIIVLYRYNEPEIKMANVEYICLGNNDEEISKNLYHALRNLDKKNPDMVYIESVPKEGLGIAIVNRLMRACEYNLI